MSRITSVRGRIVYNSRGSRTVEVDVISDGKFLGRACAPSGASVGIHEVRNFPDGGPEASLAAITGSAGRFKGLNPGDSGAVHAAVREMDDTPDYSIAGGASAFAITIAAAYSAAAAAGVPLYRVLDPNVEPRFPYPLGNVLGGGAHAGPGSPDIQEILVCATGLRDIREAIEANLAVHKELGLVLRKKDRLFAGGKGDEGGWAPRACSAEALEMAAEACENLGYALGKEVSLGVDFAASTQWDREKGAYSYSRDGFENSPGEQIDYAAGIIEKYKLIYAEDAVHEEEFDGMAELTRRFPGVLVAGDDLTVTSAAMLRKAVKKGSCNAAILKVNQAGSLYDAMKFAAEATAGGIRLVTSHRSGETTDAHVTHIGIATGSVMLKVGAVGGERVAKANELIRLSEQGLIHGMAGI
ncbi:enolase [Cenarchaeum symbiosum A]|uniref:Enolase n=1 Tax=Cenarchaeum symbiosum (strain A) TaxID=414004 RepID=A0RY13_CENSY|nr:enolase [Cenarchaeum symbiosum A]